MVEKKVEEAPAEVQGEAVSPKKKGKLLIIILALVLAIGGGGAWWFLKREKHADPKTGATEKKEESEKPPIFERLDTFTVNLQKTDGEDHYLQIEIQLKVAEDKVKEALKLRNPEIRNALLLLMSSKTQADLVTIEGKQKLAEEIAGQINKIIRAPDPKKNGVLGVYFTSFVIQ